MKRAFAFIGIFLVAACSEAPEPPIEYRDLSSEDAARKFFERGSLKEGLWKVSIKIDSATFGSLPNDGQNVRMVIGLISEKIRTSPVRELQLCLSPKNIGKTEVPGFGESCRFQSLVFDEAGGRSVMTCKKSKLLDGGTARATFTFTERGMDQKTQLDGVTDFGGTAKPRPKSAKMTGVWTYLGVCPQSGAAIS